MGEEQKNIIVFLDDEENVLNSLKRFLRTEPYDVYGTSSCEDAWDFIAQNPVKIVVSDYKMPDMTGIDFLAEVKKKFPRIIRVLFTGYEEASFNQNALLRAQIDYFIDKPWDEDDLKNTIRKGFEEFDKKNSLP
ncbi:MAG TPA: response regulator [Candidatus Omnitrophota bacterium]|nr:response regulator [Candidatus Omnitrophota bacterium]HPN88652.1 response regulator [Candidatus Omnitrophota bacterium]